MSDGEDIIRFTAEYFLSECARLRDAWSTPKFWADADNVQTAIKALGYVYVRTPGEPRVDWAWEGTIRELVRRAELIRIRPALLRAGRAAKKV